MLLEFGICGTRLWRVGWQTDSIFCPRGHYDVCGIEVFNSDVALAGSIALKEGHILSAVCSFILQWFR